MGGFNPITALTGAATGLLGGVLNNALTPRGTNAPTPLEQASAQDQAWLRDTAPLRQGAAMSLFNSLDPRTMTDARIRDILMRRAMEQGRIQASQLASQGYGDSVQAGARIGQQNQATSAANQYLNQLNSPEWMAQMARGQIDALNAGQSGSIGQAQQQRAANQQYAANQPASPWEQFIGGAGTLGPYYMPQTPGFNPYQQMGQAAYQGATGGAFSQIGSGLRTPEVNVTTVKPKKLGTI